MAVSVGPRLQVGHPHERGCGQLVFTAFGEPHRYSLVDERYRAARDYAASLGLPPLHLRRIDFRDGSAERAVRDWRNAGVTGVVAFNDDVAAAVVGAAARAGVQVPGDLAVIGHDDSPITTMFVPSLSSIHFDTAALGRGFANFALGQVEGRSLPHGHRPEQATIVARESTGVQDRD